MCDLPTKAGVTKAVEIAFATDKLIASVCHGAAGLVTALRPDGKSTVSGQRVNSFTDAEEEVVDEAPKAKKTKGKVRSNEPPESDEVPGRPTCGSDRHGPLPRTGRRGGPA